MQRRQFLSGVVPLVGAAAWGMQGQRVDVSNDASTRQFYLLRRYSIGAGAKAAQVDTYFREALIPALNRRKFKQVGIFRVIIGSSPAAYLLIPSSSIEALVLLDDDLLNDQEYLKTAAPFSHSDSISFSPTEATLLRAFDKAPALMPPGAKGPARVYELRCYESPNEPAHKKKVTTMSGGPGETLSKFDKFGFGAVFYASALVGPAMPNLTYMLSFDDLADREKKWRAFRASPEWKTISSQPGFDDMVSQITNVILSPAPYSQI
jgi:hypothetical protein